MAIISYTRQQLRVRARRLADQENSVFCSDAEIDEQIDLGNARYYMLLAECGVGFIAHTVGSDQVLTGATANIALPADFGLMVGVDRKVSDTVWEDVPAGHPGEVAREVVNSANAKMYLLQGTNLTLYPRPNSGTYRIRYIAAPVKLSGDSTTVDDWFGWSDLISIEAAIYMAAKEESYDKVMALKIRRDEIRAEVEAKRMNRMLLSPGRVRDLDDTNAPDFADWDGDW